MVKSHTFNIRKSQNNLSLKYIIIWHLVRMIVCLVTFSGLSFPLLNKFLQFVLTFVYAYMFHQLISNARLNHLATFMFI